MSSNHRLINIEKVVTVYSFHGNLKFNTSMPSSLESDSINLHIDFVEDNYSFIQKCRDECFLEKETVSILLQ